MAPRANLIGQKFHLLTVIEYCSKHTMLTTLEYYNETACKKSNTSAYWLCRCDCGNKKLVNTTHLRTGGVKSCGCLQKQFIGNLNKTHNKSKTPEYRIWSVMKSRCYNKNNSRYDDYGGRGIMVGMGWLFSFETFLKDMGKRPTKLHTIERIDNNGHYVPINCRWATRKEQARNKRNNKQLSYKGETKSMAEWVEITGLSYTTFQARLCRGWSIERVIETPVLEVWNTHPIT